jgi:hypothetical protein
MGAAAQADGGGAEDGKDGQEKVSGGGVQP